MIIANKFVVTDEGDKSYTLKRHNAGNVAELFTISKDEFYTDLSVGETYYFVIQREWSVIEERTCP